MDRRARIAAVGLLLVATASPLQAQSRAASDAFLVVAGDTVPLSPSHSVTCSNLDCLNADYRQVYDTVAVPVDEEARLVFSVPVDRVEVSGRGFRESFDAPPYLFETELDRGEIEWIWACAYWGREEEKCWQIAVRGTDGHRNPRPPPDLRPT